MRNLVPSCFSIKDSNFECKLLFGEFYFAVQGSSSYYSHDFRKEREVEHAITCANYLHNHSNRLRSGEIKLKSRNFNLSDSGSDEDRKDEESSPLVTTKTKWDIKSNDSDELESGSEDNFA